MDCTQYLIFQYLTELDEDLIYDYFTKVYESIKKQTKTKTFDPTKVVNAVLMMNELLK